MSSLLLKIWRVDQTCLFELSYGNSTIAAKLLYPETLTTLYQQWQTAYLSFYRSAFRARPGISLSLPQPTIDWRAKLVQAEAAFLAEFHHWLNSAELVEIRGEIAQATTCLFVQCDSLEMSKLPWESWQIGAGFGVQNSVQILRTSAIKATAIKPVKRSRPRILAILGDETGLNFQAEREAIQAFSIDNVEFVGWNQVEGDLKTKICEKIADPIGWDILFFAGHSNETTITGGELAIAPNTSIFISELSQVLTAAKANGLQFAIFNSCNGLSIAESLIKLGLDQVAVMREPIHNSVAREFLIYFLQCLANDQDVQQAMHSACQFLKLEQNLIYPSAYLIPSLFSTSNAQPFRIKKLRPWKALKPTRLEAIALSTAAVLSLALPLQSWLIDYRQFFQAIYRDKTDQEMQVKKPPVLLVQIDQDSLQRNKDENIINSAINRNYLAKVVNKTAQLNAPIVGLDYLLFRPQPIGDRALTQALKTAVVQKNTQFVFAAAFNSAQPTAAWDKAIPEIERWGTSGDMDLLGDPPLYARTIGDTPAKTGLAPFPYQLVKMQQGESHVQRLAPLSIYNPVSKFSTALMQMWLHPLIDYTVPPDQVYQSISAWQLLETPQISDIGDRIVLITPGGYIDAGVKPGDDNFMRPKALSYWFQSPGKITGGESHAYMIQNLLQHRLILPIPDFWMIGIAAILGKGTVIWLTSRRISRRRSRVLFGIPLIYAVTSFQIYITSAVLLPIVFPIAVYLAYLIPSTVRRRDA